MHIHCIDFFNIKKIISIGQWYIILYAVEVLSKKVAITFTQL